MHVLPPLDVPLRLGSVVRLRAALFGLLSRTIESEIVVYEPPHEFVDALRRGPLRAWRHRHFFREIEGGTELTDDIEYELPHALPFRLLGLEAMTGILAKLFAKRQALTKALIEGAIDG